MLPWRDELTVSKLAARKVEQDKRNKALFDAVVYVCQTSGLYLLCGACVAFKVARYCLPEGFHAAACHPPLGPEK